MSDLYVIISSGFLVGPRRNQHKTRVRRLISYWLAPFVNKRREITIKEGREVRVVQFVRVRAVRCVIELTGD